MAKNKPSGGHKAGDTIVSGGVTYRYTKGGHWRDDKTDKLWNNGGGGDPVADAAGGSSLGNSNYSTALNTLGGGHLGSDIASLDEQLRRGDISQEAHDAEVWNQKTKQGTGTGGTMLSEGLKDIAGGDAAIEKGFEGGAKIGASLFGEGSLGRVDENASSDQLDIQGRLKDLSGPNVDPLLQGSLDRANKTADDAQTINPELQNVLDLRKSALGGLDATQLLATKEMAQSGFNQSLTSAVRALRIGQGSNGPSGPASNIGTIPLTAQYANSQADLSRKLILDQYNAQKEARDSYSSDARDIVGGFQSNRLAANKAAGDAATGALADRTSRFNNYINYNTALRQDLYARRLQNLNTIQAEKSGQAAALFGGGSFAAQQEGEKKSFDLAEKNLDLQKDIFNSGAGGDEGGGEEETTSPGHGDSDTFG